MMTVPSTDNNLTVTCVSSLPRCEDQQILIAHMIPMPMYPGITNTIHTRVPRRIARRNLRYPGTRGSPGSPLSLKLRS
eukprot:909370-Rhodomonas_salina.1